MNDLISVIVPVYNCEKYIKKCIDSILNQTYTNIEVIVVDDGSTDNSLNVCKEILDIRMKVYHNENRGLSFSRQFGIDICEGNYFVTIDADDYILPDYIYKLYNSIIETNSDISVCNRFDFINNKNRIIERNHTDKVLILDKKSILTNYRDLCEKCGLSDSWDKMYRTEFVKKSNVKFNLPKGFNGNDLLFNYKLALHCPKFSFVFEPLLMHRLTPNSMVRTANKPMIEGFQYIIEQIKKEANICGYDETINYEISKIFGLFVYLIFNYYVMFSSNLHYDINKCYDALSDYIEKNDFLDYVTYSSSIQEEIIYYDCLRKGLMNKIFKKAKYYRLKNNLKRLLRI